MILTILIGPNAAFLVIASVLTVQAIFFADGGLLALDCNIFNLGFLPAFIAYPFVYKKIVGHSHSRGRIFAGSIAGAVGVVEGLVTVVVVLFVQRTRPEILERAATGRSLAGLKLKPVLIGLGIAASKIAGSGV